MVKITVLVYYLKLSQYILFTINLTNLQLPVLDKFTNKKNNTNKKVHYKLINNEVNYEL